MSDGYDGGLSGGGIRIEAKQLGGIRRGKETDRFINTKVFKSSEVKTCVKTSCDQRCRKLGKIVSANQLEVDYINRNENQRHKWVVDNVAAAVVYCEGKPLLGCNAEVVKGRVYDEGSEFAGFEPHFLPVNDRVTNSLREVFDYIKFGVNITPDNLV